LFQARIESCFTVVCARQRQPLLQHGGPFGMIVTGLATRSMASSMRSSGAAAADRGEGIPSSSFDDGTGTT